MPDASEGAGQSVRTRAFGQEYRPTAVDKLGVWLSARQIRRHVGSLAGKHIGDFGCGYHATFARSVLGEVAHATLVDVALAPDLKCDPRVTAIEGQLPEAFARLPDGALDLAMCVSVLEHLADPLAGLVALRRVLRADGLCLVNVPSWRGKWFLETSAFKLGLSPRAEMDDHKMYYDPRDLWPLLVRAGFLPHGIRVFRHKLGLNTFAVCKREN
jgi:SAM-dependent methyltransferase